WWRGCGDDDDQYQQAPVQTVRHAERCSGDPGMECVLPAQTQRPAEAGPCRFMRVLSVKTPPPPLTSPPWGGGTGRVSAAKAGLRFQSLNLISVSWPSTSTTCILARPVGPKPRRAERKF